MAEFEIVSGIEVPKDVLQEFFKRVYRPQKAAYLSQHAGWLYGGEHNQWIVLSRDEIAGYCAVIPTTCWINCDRSHALWWVDLVVSPDYRGRGIANLIDKKIRKATDLKLGFPNELAARIHRKHNWGVREDGHILLMPLRPRQLNGVRRARGNRGFVLKTLSLGITPLVEVWKWKLRGYTPSTAHRLNRASAELLASIFSQYKHTMPVTTYRDVEFLRWRYLDAPYADELYFYVAGPESTPTHCVIARYVESDDVLAVRILDLFGDLQDLDNLKDTLQLAIRDAIDSRAAQITMLSFLPELGALLRRLGFLIRAPARFCWHSQTERTMQAFDGPQHWVLGDSDNDEPGYGLA